MKTITYFVAYACGPLHGRAPVTLAEPIRGMADIAQIEDHLQRQCAEAGMQPGLVRQLVVVNFQPFEEEKPCLITGN